MDEKSVRGKLYDIQGFSVHDGPGVRTTVFLKGCPLHCPWCHSPESQSFHTQMSYVSVRCIGTELCGACLRVCPAEALVEGEAERDSGGALIRRVRWDSGKCRQCGACAQQCYPGALSLCGKDWSVEEVREVLRKDYSYFQSSGGGVTVSGGEPLSQPDFTLELLKEVKEDGIHTALDTTGYAPPEIVERVLPYTDLFLYDLKQMDSQAHKRIVGVPNERILENARLIARRGGKLQIRIPVIPGLNDASENLKQAAVFCVGLGEAVTLVQLLPYHHFGASKYERIQMRDPMPCGIEPPSEEQMQEYLELMKSYGLQVIVH